MLEQLSRAPVENELKQEFVAAPQQLHARRFVNPARFHAHEPIFHDVRADSHAMPSGDSVGDFEGGFDVHRLAVYLGRNAALPADGDNLRPVRRVPRPDAHARLHERGGDGDVFEIARLVGQPQKIGVRRVAGLARRAYGQVVRLAVLYHLLASGKALHELRVAPGGVNLRLRIHHVRGELKAHLVVAPAGRAVEEGVDAALLETRQNRADGDGAGDAGGVPVAALIARLRLNYLQPRLRQRLAPRDDNGVRRAASDHALGDGVQIFLVGLSQVHRKGLDFETLVPKPARHRAAVQPAGHRAADYVDVFVL